MILDISKDNSNVQDRIYDKKDLIGLDSWSLKPNENNQPRVLDGITYELYTKSVKLNRREIIFKKSVVFAVKIFTFGLLSNCTASWQQQVETGTKEKKIKVLCNHEFEPSSHKTNQAGQSTFSQTNPDLSPKNPPNTQANTQTQTSAINSKDTLTNTSIKLPDPKELVREIKQTYTRLDEKTEQNLSKIAAEIIGDIAHQQKMREEFPDKQIDYIKIPHLFYSINRIATILVLNTLLEKKVIHSWSWVKRHEDAAIKVKSTDYYDKSHELRIEEGFIDLGNLRNIDTFYELMSRYEPNLPKKK